MPGYRYDHIHLRSPDPNATARSHEQTGPAPGFPHYGLEHFGLTVDNLDAAVTEHGRYVLYALQPPFTHWVRSQPNKSLQPASAGERLSHRG